MKYMLIGLIALVSGCATVSDYNQGCRDGVEGLKLGSTENFRKQYCNELDKVRESQKRMDRQTGRQ